MHSIAIGQYLINRLKEINIDVIFGVPGDFNMSFLDIVEEDSTITWGNNANELNASYAADGYARIRGAGALLTTFGVGELSAINGVAGSYAEMVSVIHIVGTPSTKSQASGAATHHSLGDGNFKVFKDMYNPVTCASTHLTKQTALSEIDRVISQAFFSKRTGYIGIPVDLFKVQVEIPDILAPLEIQIPKNHPDVQAAALKVIVDAMNKAKHPVIIVDGCVVRHGIQKTVQEFVDRSGFPVYVTAMAKGAVDESTDQFRGCYVGKASLENVNNEIGLADLFIQIGHVKSDVNTGNFTNFIDHTKIIELHSSHVSVFGVEYQKVSMMELIPLLTKALSDTSRIFNLGPRTRLVPAHSGERITNSCLWSKVCDYMEEDAIVCADMGTATFSSLGMDAPKGTAFLSQILWCSIGYSVGAAVGAALADRSRRVYLFVGDGSFQIACQEISLFLRHGLTPVIILLNNQGYLMERLMSGPNRSYNNIKTWNYSQSLTYFGAYIQEEDPTMKISEVGFQGTVTNHQEFDSAMELVQSNPDKIHFLEVVLPRMDAPRTLDLLLTEFRRV
ncbi:pyruvate decarboxylase PdcB [Sporodiniella umbellata]|nr:pyruvate decarboxylase PdcB [Sporodiniella umbellata]